MTLFEKILGKWHNLIKQLVIQNHGLEMNRVFNINYDLEW
jgi:hypothetical protein